MFPVALLPDQYPAVYT